MVSKGPSLFPPFRQVQRERKYHEQRKKKNAPVPLPETRPRSLTLPLPEAGTENRVAPSQSRKWRDRLFSKPPPEPIIQRTLDQKESLLPGKLPAEIRAMIWGYFLIGNRLHIVRGSAEDLGRARLLGIRCAKDLHTFSCNHYCWGLGIRGRGHSFLPEPGYYYSQYENSDTGEVNFVSLLRTCRLIYSEIINLIYQQNTFDFNHADTIIEFSKTLLPSRLNQIRVVRFSNGFFDRDNEYRYDHAAWVEACRILGTMSNLAELCVHIHGIAPAMVQNQAIIFDPLLQIRQPRVFDVHIMWHVVPRAEYHVPDMPFRIIQHERDDCRMGYADVDEFGRILP